MSILSNRAGQLVDIELLQLRAGCWLVFLRALHLHRLIIGPV